MAALLSSAPSETDGRKPSAPGQASSHRRPSVRFSCWCLTISVSRGDARRCWGLSKQLIEGVNPLLLRSVDSF
eukprot:3586029-Rhodomonas_salina.1